MASINSILIPNLAEELCPIGGNFIVVFADFTTDRICLINQLGKPKKPISLSYRHIKTCIENGYINVGIMEPLEKHKRPDAFFQEASIKKRDEQYQIILPLIENIEEFLFSSYGSELVKKIAQTHGKQKCQIYTWLYSYLRGGQSKNSLLPNYKNGCRSADKIYSKKLGRPQKNSPFIGKNIIEKDKSNFLKILRKYYLKHQGKTLSECYEDLLLKYYCDKTFVAPNGSQKHIYKTQDELPTIQQFRYWAKKLLSDKGINAVRIRKGATAYDCNFAGRNGEIVRADGPGQIYQLDSTPVDHEFCSEFSRDRTLRVGRGTIYRLVDIFHGGTTGLHTTLASPSWAEARLAIFNAIRSKVEYCAEYEVKISEEDWPMRGVPMTIYVDNAELASKLAEAVPVSVCTIKFGRVWRGDDKDMVEKTHDLHAQRTKHRIPGFISKAAGDRGVRSAKETAVLTLREFTKTLIDVVIQRNNVEELDGKWLSREMIKDNILPHSRDLYLWGEINRPFSKKDISDAEIYMQLLEKGEARIHKEGIYFNKLWYRSEWALMQGLQNKKINRNKAIKIEVRYLRYNMTHLLLCTDEGFQLAVLHENSRRFDKLSLEEIEIQLNQETFDKKSRDKKLHESRGDLNHSIEETVANAQKEQVWLPLADINNQTIADNKNLDLFAEKNKETQRMDSFIASTFTTDQTDDQNSSVDVEKLIHQQAIDQKQSDHESIINSLKNRKQQ